MKSYEIKENEDLFTFLFRYKVLPFTHGHKINDFIMRGKLNILNRKAEFVELRNPDEILNWDIYGIDDGKNYFILLKYCLHHSGLDFIKIIKENK